MGYTVAQIAALLNGKVIGNSESVIDSPGRIENARSGQISFLANLNYENHIYGSKASAILVHDDFLPKKDNTPTLIKVKNVRQAVQILLGYYAENSKSTGIIHEKAEIAESTVLSENVSIGSFSVLDENVNIGMNTVIDSQCFIGNNVKIGKNCKLYAGVKIYDNCIIGNNVIIHSNVVIGSDGFGFLPSQDGSYEKVAQIGNVIIEDNVEIGSNTCIDRAVMGSTILQKGVKLDNLIQVGHNVEIGENTVIAAQTGIAGSTRIGKNCRIGGQVGFMGHIEIADGTQIQAKSGVLSTVKKKNSSISGVPAIGFYEFYRSSAVFKKLPEILKDIRIIKKEIRNLK